MFSGVDHLLRGELNLLGLGELGRRLGPVGLGKCPHLVDLGYQRIDPLAFLPDRCLLGFGCRSGGCQQTFGLGSCPVEQRGGLDPIVLAPPSIGFGLLEDGGETGVDLFFVLSGLLITRVLLERRDRPGRGLAERDADASTIRRI